MYKRQLVYDVFKTKTTISNPDITDLRPQTISKDNPWFSNKPYRLKKYYVDHFLKFCRQLDYNTIEEYCLKEIGTRKNLLINMWKNSIRNTFITFDSIRKITQINHWCKDYIDKNYDLIFIDEAQDFDPIMLEILLKDTTIPKIFVGDTRQAIYEWRGCINSFDKLPTDALIIELYSTFRIGNPACQEIRKKFKDCWIISKNKNITTIEYDTEPKSNYVYLFRSWRYLLQMAQKIKNIWIFNYDKQVVTIKNLHKKLQISDLTLEDKENFSDDLPAFLIKLSASELENLLSNINNNLVDEKKCVCKMYTIHSYKGLESDIIKIYDDTDIIKEENIYYVALTRGIKNIIINTENIIDIENEKKEL